MRFKRCAKCGEEKPATFEFFALHRQCRDGIGPYCLPCRRGRNQAYRQANREALSARRREKYKIDNGEAHRQREDARRLRQPYVVSAEHLIGGLKARANDRGLCVADEFRKKEFVVEWLMRQPTCECCGVFFYFGKKNGVKHDASPSFDRFRSDDGYSIKNTCLICWRCNNIKRNYASEDLRMVARWIDYRNKFEVGA